VRGIRQHLRKRLGRLAELQRQLAASYEAGYRGQPYTRAALEKHLVELTRGQYLNTILRATVEEHEGRLSLAYGVDRQAFQGLRDRGLGKRILFTGNGSCAAAGVDAA